MAIISDLTAPVQHGPATEWTIVSKSYHDLDPSNLNRAGLVKQALDRWFLSNPTDCHPTIDQLVSVGHNLHRRTVQRGLKELVASGQVIHIYDPDHIVGRMTIVKSVPVAVEHATNPMTTSSRDDHLGAPELSTRDWLGAPNQSTLLRSNNVIEDNVERCRDNSFTPQKAESRPQPPEPALSPKPATRSPSPEPGPLADPFARFANRLQAQLGQEIAQAIREPKLAPLGHLEHQERLPIDIPSRPDPNLKLMTAVGRLETGDMTAVEPAVLKMVEQFKAEEFEGAIRKVLSAVQRGYAPFAGIIAAIEEASRTNVRMPGPALATALNRQFPTLIKLKARNEPASEPRSHHAAKA